MVKLGMVEPIASRILVEHIMTTQKNPDSAELAIELYIPFGKLT